MSFLQERHTVALLQSGSEEPQSKLRRYVVTAIALVLILAGAGWFFFRFVPEKRTVVHFMDAVTGGNYEQAYQIWKPHGTYSYQDFLADWSLQGYYGPIRSFQLESAEEPHNGGSGVIVVVEVSSVSPFPSDKDPQSGHDREVRLWVERSDQSISFPP
jgi:hypothetical protein